MKSFQYIVNLGFYLRRRWTEVKKELEDYFEYQSFPYQIINICNGEKVTIYQIRTSAVANRGQSTLIGL